MIRPVPLQDDGWRVGIRPLLDRADPGDRTGPEALGHFTGSSQKKFVVLAIADGLADIGPVPAWQGVGFDHDLQTGAFHEVSSITSKTVADIKHGV